MHQFIRTKTKDGFTIIESVVALAGMAVLAVTSMAFLFSILSQRDQAVAESIVTEQPEIVFPVLGKTIKSAQEISVEDDGRRLKTTREGECFTFAWDQEQQVILFGRQGGSTCVPPEEVTARLTPNTVKVTSLQFELLEPSESARSVQLNMDVAAYRPLWQTNQHFSQVFINVTD